MSPLTGPILLSIAVVLAGTLLACAAQLAGLSEQARASGCCDPSLSLKSIDTATITTAKMNWQ